MKDGGWKTKPEFSKYSEALKGIPKESKLCADQEFFEKLPIKSMEDYERNLEKHMFNQWRSDKLLPYVIGGNPPLAREFTRML